MIPSALILPTERPPTARELKRALLTYDAVHLCSPDDRELIPPNTYMTVCMGMPPIFGMPVGAVRPLGKLPRYDDSFTELLESCKDAINQGSLKLLAAPLYEQGMTIGGVRVPDGIPEPGLTYRAFRAMAAQPDLIASVAQGMETFPSLATIDYDELAPKGADDFDKTLFVNGRPSQSPDPPVALYPGFASTHEERILLTRLCLARLGSLSRNLLACEIHDLAPYTSDSGLASVIQALEAKLPLAFDQLFHGDDQRAELTRLQRLEDVVITEFVDLDGLDELSIADVLKLRTKAWGTGNEARHQLNKALKSIALDSATDEAFRKAAKYAIDEYLGDSADLRHGLRTLMTNAFCDIGVRTMQSGGLFATAEMLQKFLVAGSPQAALVFGGLYHVFKFTKDHAAEFLDYVKKREEVRGSSGYSLFRTFESFPRKK